MLYIIYEVYLIFVFYLWYLVIQCPISIHEKRILYKENTIDLSKRLQVYIDLLIPEKLFINIFLALYTINISLVMFCLAQYYSSLPKQI